MPRPARHSLTSVLSPGSRRNRYFDLAAATCAQLLELRLQGDAPLEQMVSLLSVIFGGALSSF